MNSILLKWLKKDTEINETDGRIVSVINNKTSPRVFAVTFDDGRVINLEVIDKPIQNRIKSLVGSHVSIKGINFKAYDGHKLIDLISCISVKKGSEVTIASAYMAVASLLVIIFLSVYVIYQVAYFMALINELSISNIAKSEYMVFGGFTDMQIIVLDIILLSILSYFAFFCRPIKFIRLRILIYLYIIKNREEIKQHDNNQSAN